MPRREPPNPKRDIPSFPRPRIPERPSPYRAHIAPSPSEPDTPPPAKARVVVTRPEPPTPANSLGRRRYVADEATPPDPIPAGWFDEIRRKLTPFTTALSNHLHLVGLILVLLYALFVASVGRKLGGFHFF